MSLLDPASFILVNIGIFLGALVSGMVGFAFSAVAGAVLLHVLPPTDAVPLMMACSIVTQGVSLVALRGTVQWHGNPMLILSGAIGIVPALYLLNRIDTQLFRTGFGAFLVLFAAYMLFRPSVTRGRFVPGRARDAIIGFGGGLIGGLTAMPGALPTMWCELRGLPKEEQRGLLQPYITAMQLIALALMLSGRSLPPHALASLLLSLPALVGGAALGVIMFRRVDGASFRRVVLSVLLVAGSALVV